MILIYFMYCKEAFLLFKITSVNFNIFSKKYLGKRTFQSSLFLSLYWQYVTQHLTTSILPKLLEAND